MARFQKGQSGNPGGRPKDEHGIRELARSRSSEAIAALSDIMNDKASPPAARVSAACAILDRGYGRPTQAVQHSEKLDLAQITTISLGIQARLENDPRYPEMVRRHREGLLRTQEPLIIDMQDGDGGCEPELGHSGECPPAPSDSS